MDRLSALLNLFQPEARHVSQSNLNDGALSVPQDDCSRLYLVKSGRLQLTTPYDEQTLNCQCGDLIWLPRGDAHQLAELREELCEELREDGVGFDQQPAAVVTQIDIAFLHREPNQELNLLQSTLPALLYLPASESQISNLKPLVELMFQEAGQQRCGHTTVVNRLAEVLLVNLLRHLMANQKVATGVLGGLSDLRLARAMTGIHDTPGENWTLEELANTAGMSRTAFSKRFREVVGFTPADYLAHWRMSIACKKISSGTESIAAIADELGYQSETAFRRAFRKVTGHPPGFYKKGGSFSEIAKEDTFEA